MDPINMYELVKKRQEGLRKEVEQDRLLAQAMRGRQRTIARLQKRLGEFLIKLGAGLVNQAIPKDSRGHPKAQVVWRAMERNSKAS